MNSTFFDSGNGVGLVTFDPDYTQAGNYDIFVIASDGVDADTASIRISVYEAGNQAPVLDSIGPKLVMETSTLNFNVTASDPDGTLPELYAEDLPLNATFVDSGTGVGTFEFTPELTQSGIYYVLFYTTDGEFADSETVEIVVAEIGNQPPVIDSIPPQIVQEGDTLVLGINAVDPEGDSIQLFLNDEIDNVTFVDSGGGVGSIVYTPTYFQSGIDTMRILAIDNGEPEMTDIFRLIITTIDVNRPPVIDSIGPQAILLGDSLVLHVTATDSSDPDGGRIYLSALDKPVNSTFVDSATNAGLFVFKPTASQVGVDTLKLAAFDDEDPPLSDIEIIPITVVAANQPPFLDTIGPQTVTEADTLEFVVTASDPDGPMLSLLVDTLPENAEFVDSGNGVGVFTFMPDYMQSGLVKVKFTASDGMLSDYEHVFIQIYDNPQPPVIVVPADTSLTEGEQITFDVTATDPDLTTPELLLDNPAINASFTDNEDGSGTFTFAPAYVQAGVYDFLFIATDGVMADSGVVTVTVNEAGNQTPTISSPDTVVAQETDLIEFTVNSTDADSVLTVLSSSALPAGATFADSGDYTGTFTWQTENLDLGNYDIWFYAEDGNDPSLVDSSLTVVVVTDLNLPPSKLFIHQIRLSLNLSLQ